MADKHFMKLQANTGYQVRGKGISMDVVLRNPPGSKNRRVVVDLIMEHRTDRVTADLSNDISVWKNLELKLALDEQDRMELFLKSWRGEYRIGKAKKYQL